MWLSRIRRKSHIPSLYHIPSISPICMVQILGLKREIRIAFSWNGSICLLKWNRNVIWNQCIRTCLDISTMPLHTLLLSLCSSLHLSMSLTLSASFPLANSIITAVWRNSRGRSLNVKPCQAKRSLSCSGHHENKVCKRHVEKKKEGKKAKSTPLHTALTSILSVPLTCNRIAERTLRSTKNMIGRDRQLSLLCLACHTLCTLDN